MSMLHHYNILITSISKRRFIGGNLVLGKIYETILEEWLLKLFKMLNYKKKRKKKTYVDIAMRSIRVVPVDF